MFPFKFVRHLFADVFLADLIISLIVYSSFVVCFFHFTGFTVENITYYEAVDYDVSNIHKQHINALNFPNRSVIIEFGAFQR